jgi:uncharacterized membrane protein
MVTMPEPLHPAVIHFPIVLSVLLPIVVVTALLVIRGKPGGLRSPWMTVVVVCAALSLSAWVGIRTGEADEEGAEEVVPESAIHEHEEAAEAFLWGTVVALLVAAAGLSRGQAGRAARYVSVPVALVVLGLGYRVGAAGGDLVYEYGAAQVYASTGSSQGEGPRESSGRRRSDDDDDDDDDHREGR